MADIQERRRERQTCSDEGEWRAISRGSWFPPPFGYLPTQHYNKKMFCLVKNEESFFFFFFNVFKISLVLDEKKQVTTLGHNTLHIPACSFDLRSIPIFF